MSHITLLKIWNMNVQEAENSLDLITSKGYKVKTSSDNIYVKIISCFSGLKSSFLSEFENDILANKSFINFLEVNVEKYSHSDALINTLYMVGKNHEMVRVEKLQKEIISKHIKQENEEKEIEVKRKEESAGVLLENTYNADMSDICPFNPHDNSSFYFTDPNTGHKKLLEAHHIFQSKGHCYDIDSVFRYIIAGGKVNLDEHYIKRIFNDKGKVDYSNEGLSTQVLKNKTYHENTKIIDLSNNSITSMLDVHLPKTTQMLILDSNPLGDNYFFNETGSNIIHLSMKNCQIKVLDFKHLPESLVNLNVSNNPNLTTIGSIGHLKRLSSLDIRGTDIKNLNINKFQSLKSNDSNHKLNIYCDKDIKIKSKDDKNVSWINIIKST